jgi:hypothetical protein
MVNRAARPYADTAVVRPVGIQSETIVVPRTAPFTRRVRGLQASI